MTKKIVTHVTSGLGYFYIYIYIVYTYFKKCIHNISLYWIHYIGDGKTVLLLCKYNKANKKCLYLRQN